MTTRDDIGFYWHVEGGYEEVAGVECYAYFPRGSAAWPAASLAELWPEGEAESQVSTIPLDGTEFPSGGGETLVVSGEVLVVSIKVLRWPADAAWRRRLEATLAGTVRAGATVAWAGDETCSWSLCALSPHGEGANVYAAYSEPTGYLCNAGLSEPLDYLTDEQTARLWDQLRD